MDRNKPGSFKKKFQFKRKKTNKNSNRPSFSHEPNAGLPNASDTVYRILCPSSKIGSVIGKGGSIINALRDETRAKIRVSESVPGTDERVIIIFSSATRKPRRYNANEDDEDDVVTENEHESLQPHCPAQDALLKVHERMAEEDDLFGGITCEDNNENSVVTARLLVPNNQVGCLLGKGGNIIQKLRTETNANIRILPAEHLPACAMSNDELVQISGASDVAKRALYEVSTILHQNPRKDNPSVNYSMPSGSPGFYPPGPPMANMLPQRNPMWSHRNSGAHGAPPMPWMGGYGSGFNGVPPLNAGEASDEFSMKILCAAGKIGGVIGKGGATVKQLQQETGANIQVDDTVPEGEERAIVVSSFEALWNPISPTIEAILHLQNKTSEMSEKGIITTRLLVPSSKVGCLLGQGGHVITEMRRRTQADIRVISKDGKPKCASEDEELVQICGNIAVAREALSEIASRLRVRTLRGSNAALEPPSVPPPFQGFGPPGPIPPGPSGNFPGRTLPPSGMTGISGSGGYEHLQALGHEYEGQSYPVQPSATGYANVSSSMEVKVPYSAVGSLLGTGGSSISNIREVSGARVKLQDPQSGASECVVEIHGSNEQMNAAQNLLQAFISSAVQNFNSQQQAYQ
ncbi:KH domain-containing protein At4g18375-like isoform X1 [Macadamia integrifolia]|uniref:KH domain-containing protein At4g18375-like isoform X1 n=1 Tax=Macadamia integrifolia TaxID=60698 RepID=UPI001C4F758B|nr:KH domain-containing protein At4g18375-like isoform X1 [Macadamia integrifolia]